jgi:hypothetical protein
MTTTSTYPPQRPLALMRSCGCEFDPWVFGHDYAFCRLMQQVRARRSG